MGDLSLNDLKSLYGGLAGKYDLPSFEDLNNAFEIDRIDRESDCMLRVIRKVIMEKIVSSLTFLETLMNPVNAPNIYLHYIKSMDSDDRKIINEIYAVLGKLSIDSLNLEINYREDKEAELIRDSVSDWEKIKNDFEKILRNMKNPKTTEARERNYFG